MDLNLKILKQPLRRGFIGLGVGVQRLFFDLWHFSSTLGSKSYPVIPNYLSAR